MSVASRAVFTIMIVAALAGCGKSGQGEVSVIAPAARVDGVAISQQAVVTAVPASDERARKAQLETFVAEQLLANAAVLIKLDSDAAVMAALEEARRQVLAKAYIAKRKADLPPPSDQEIRAFYDEHPELFAKRRVYRLQEIVITAPADRIDEIAKRVDSLKTFDALAKWLKEKNLPFTVGVAVKPAEEWPSDLLSTLAKLKDGNAFNMRHATGLTVVQVTAAEDKPVDVAQARVAIERFIANRKLGELINQETGRLRRAAKIEYLGPYLAKGP